MVEVLSSKVVQKTRKAWRCNGCNRQFEAGTKKYEQFNKDCGDTWTWRTCPTCEAICSALFAFDSDIAIDGVQSDHIVEWMRDEYGSWEAADKALATSPGEQEGEE